MPLTASQKKELLTGFQRHPKDSGSSEVQVSLLTARINELTGHLEKAVKDHSSRRGLLKMVGRRKRLLSYLKRNHPEGYQKLIDQLELRK